MKFSYNDKKTIYLPLRVDVYRFCCILRLGSNILRLESIILGLGLNILRLESNILRLGSYILGLRLGSNILSLGSNIQRLGSNILGLGSNILKLESDVLRKILRLWVEILCPVHNIGPTLQVQVFLSLIASNVTGKQVVLIR